MPLSVLGLGLATPPYSIEQHDAAEVAHSMTGPNGSSEKVIRRLFEKSLVAKRGSVLLEEPGELSYRQTFYPAANIDNDKGPTTAERIQAYGRFAAPLAKQACERAITAAEIETNSVTHLITVSCTGFESPGVDFRLIDQLGLSPDVSRTNVGFMGCHGAFNAMRVAESFATADPNAVVLLCCIELCSLHCIYGDEPQQMVASSLFADGAGAMIIRGEQAQDDCWKLQATGSRQFPGSLEAMTWNIGDHGFEMTLSPEVPAAIERELPGYMNDWLAKCDLQPQDIASWAIHPGGPRIIDAAAQALAIAPEKTQASFDVLANHGNMSSATILFVINQLMNSNAELPCVAMAFGPGLVVESALFV